MTAFDLGLIFASWRPLWALGWRLGHHGMGCTPRPPQRSPYPRPHAPHGLFGPT